MSVYLYRANNNICRDGRLRFFYCNECGSVNLSNPHESESDHRDVLRFKCNNCGNFPYYSHMNIFDVIQLTTENIEDIKYIMCNDFNIDPNEFEFYKEILENING